MLLKIPGFGKILGNIGGVFRGNPGDGGLKGRLRAVR
jgi:hypothetical protein